MKNETILYGFGFYLIGKIMQILEGVIHLCQSILPLISIIHTQPCPIPVNYHYR